MTKTVGAGFACPIIALSPHRGILFAHENQDPLRFTNVSLVPLKEGQCTKHYTLNK